MKTKDDVSLEIPKSEIFLKASKDLSNFLLTLNISTKEYNELLKRLIEYTAIVRKDAFTLGIVPKISKQLKN